MTLNKQLEKLGMYLMTNFPSEIGSDEGAGDTAVRLLQRLKDHQDKLDTATAGHPIKFSAVSTAQNMDGATMFPVMISPQFHTQPNGLKSVTMGGPVAFCDTFDQANELSGMLNGYEIFTTKYMHLLPTPAEAMAGDPGPVAADDIEGLPGQPPMVHFQYTNHKGEMEQRHVSLISLEWQQNPGWGYEPGWFLHGFDQDRNNYRTFRIDTSHMLPGLNPPDDGGNWELVSFSGPYVGNTGEPMTEAGADVGFTAAGGGSDFDFPDSPSFLVAEGVAEDPAMLFGMWLTTRKHSIKVGGDEPVYDMIDAIKEYQAMVSVVTPLFDMAGLQQMVSARAEIIDPLHQLDGLFFSNEMGGECGEAQNVVKKLVRERLGIPGSRATVAMLGGELADTIITACNVARCYNIDLTAEIKRIFNETSDKHGIAIKFY